MWAVDYSLPRYYHISTRPIFFVLFLHIGFLCQIYVGNRPTGFDVGKAQHDDPLYPFPLLLFLRLNDYMFVSVDLQGIEL